VLARRAAAYVAALRAEPSDSDVKWLARAATAGDVDHARWELRYARRALGLLIAQRDSLDDRTPSAIAKELVASLDSAELTDAAKLEIAQRQFNQRLAAYADALADRRSREPSPTRLGRTLFSFAGLGLTPAGPDLARAATLLADFQAEAAEALHRVFGTASLPEDVAPSAADRSRSG
jgi:hypothetical protein